MRQRAPFALRSCFALSLLTALFSAPLFGQVLPGLPPFGSFSGGSFDTVNNANLNVHFEIPILNKPGAGLPFYYILTYDGAVWYPSGGAWTPVTKWGWNNVSTGTTGYLIESTQTGFCFVGPTRYTFTYYSFGPYIDPFGTVHNVYVSTTTGSTQCNVRPVNGGTSTATDGSDYTLTVSGTQSADVRVQSPSGRSIVPYGPLSAGPPSVSDANGNSITTIVSGGTTSFVDTLGVNPALSVSGSGTPSSPNVLTYPGPSGNVSVSVNYSSFTVATNFGCPGVSEYPATPVNLVSSISLPDGTSYSFQYDTSGRLHSVTLPTGGTITYTYSGGNNGITCTDGSAATLTRATPDGTWTYAHSEVGTSWTTAVTDPQNNVTNYNFQQVSGASNVY